MPQSDNGTNGDGTEDEDGSPRSYREYQLAKNPRANDPEDAGSRDPAAEMREAASIGSGFEALEGDGDVSKSAQKTLEDALDDWDPTGTDVAKSDEERVSLSLSQSDIEQASLTNEEKRLRLLEDIRDRLDAIDGPTPSAKQVLREASRNADLSKSENAVDLLESIEEELERQEGKAEAAKLALEQYLADEERVSLSSTSLAEFGTWLRSNMAEGDGDDERQTRRRVRSRLDQMLADAESGERVA